nr:MAG TPA: hypothetical protein [Caudoviricetes sp.]
MEWCLSLFRGFNKYYTISSCFLQPPTKNPPAPAFLRVMVQGDYHFTLTLR